MFCVGEVNYWGEPVDVRTVESRTEEVMDQQRADVGFACASPAMKGHNQRFHGIMFVHKLPHPFHHEVPYQVLTEEIERQVAFQTWEWIKIEMMSSGEKQTLTTIPSPSVAGDISQIMLEADLSLSSLSNTTQHLIPLFNLA